MTLRIGSLIVINSIMALGKYMNVMCCLMVLSIVSLIVAISITKPYIYIYIYIYTYTHIKCYFAA